jgi:hypothetical protein
MPRWGHCVCANAAAGQGWSAAAHFPRHEGVISRQSSAGSRLAFALFLPCFTSSLSLPVTLTHSEDLFRHLLNPMQNALVDLKVKLALSYLSDTDKAGIGLSYCNARAESDALEAALAQELNAERGPTRIYYVGKHPRFLVTLQSRVGSIGIEAKHYGRLREIADKCLLVYNHDAAWEAKTEDQPMQDLNCWSVFLVDHRLSEKEKVLVSQFALSGMSLVASPAAASEFLWGIKAYANSIGGIFEIASTQREFGRLSAIATEATSRRRALELAAASRVARVMQRYQPKEKPKPATADSDELAALPGVVAATAHLQSERGRLDANLIAALFGMTRADLARLADVSAEAIRQTPDAESLQPLLREFEKAARLTVLDPDAAKFRTWLNSPNEEFDQQSPLELIKSGRVSKVAELVHDILTNRGH